MIIAKLAELGFPPSITHGAHLLRTASPPKATAYQVPTADQGRRQTRTEHASHSMERGLSRAWVARKVLRAAGKSLSLTLPRGQAREHGVVSGGHHTHEPLCMGRSMSKQSKSRFGSPSHS